MKVTEPMVLPSDVRLVPVAELSEALRSRMGAEETDYAISRPGSRSASKLIDAGAADFLEEFRTPTTVVDAAIRYGSRTGTDPEQVLEDAFGLVMHLSRSRYLVETGSADVSGIKPNLVPGDSLGDGEVLRCVHVTEDTEVYEVRMPDDGRAAGKVLRSGHQAMMSSSLDHEAAILRRLDGDPSPRLLETGSFDGRPYLLTEWCTGTDASVLADHLRRSDPNESRRDLLRLAIAIVQAYERLHGLGVVHADVNPRNVLVGSDAAVRILDFGLSTSENDPVDGFTPRGGWSYLYEPEAAGNFLHGGRGSTPTRLGEQYSLGALLDYLLTGRWYLDFKASAEEMYAQILDETPVGFQERGIPAWPAVEKVLRRAMSKLPADRFPSLTEFREGLVHASGRQSERSTQAPDPGRARRRTDFLARLLPRYRLDGELFRSDVLPAPTVSVGYGRAGIAHALHRMACAADDAPLLARADAWSLSAIRRADRAGAFTNDEIGVTATLVGSVSTLFGPPGPPVVQAMIAGAMGDSTTQANAVAKFVGLADKPCDISDATLGLAGILLAGAMLSEAPGVGSTAAAGLKGLGNRTLKTLWELIDAQPPIGEGGPVRFLGIAHGWAGMLYATLQWCGAAGIGTPSNTGKRLDELAACAEQVGSGLRWPSERFTGQPSGSRTYMSGWCHGTAGYTILWNLADRLLKDDRYRALAQGSARYTWEDPDGYPSLCCGLAGRGYALLDTFQCTGEEMWAERAGILADRAVARIHAIPPGMEHSLYKGQLGIAALISDLGRPESASFPFFQHERSRGGSAPLPVRALWGAR